MKCSTCKVTMEPPAEIPEGFPGVKYYVCLGCGRTVPVASKRPRKEILK